MGSYVPVLPGDSSTAAQYNLAAERRVEAVEALLWNEEKGAWFDYNLRTNSTHTGFYASNLAPIWAQCYKQPAMGDKALQYLKVGSSLFKLHIINMFFRFLIWSAP